jgi:uncharacterized protein YyaL (SSP411 family)
MLYDNAQLASLYTHAWQIRPHPMLRWVATRTLDYLLRELRHPDGSFFSSQDADSGGEEGAFFVWSYEEFVGVAEEAVGDRRLADGVAAYFGIDPGGNWEGRSVPWKPRSIEEVAERAGVSVERMHEVNEVARLALLARRAERVHPATDDKVLAAWNGLAISALAEAGRAFGEPRYVEAAAAAADFVLTHLRDGHGRLLRSWREGRPGRPGFLDDHALLAEGLLALYETAFDERFFVEARRLADEMLRLFRDTDGGGFFQTGVDAEALVVRPKELFDNAVPSGNSAAASVLLRLALLTGEPEYERAGTSALRAVRDLLPKAPSAFGRALSALDLYLASGREVAIVGDPGAEETRRLIHEVHRRFLPNAVLAVGAPGRASAVPLLEGRGQVGGRATAYVCEGFVCRRPVVEPEELAAQL